LWGWQSRPNQTEVVRPIPRPTMDGGGSTTHLFSFFEEFFF